MEVMSKRALDGLKAYQYKPSGYTILDKWHAPGLNWATTKLPLWLAPNLITLIGTMLLVASYLLSAHYTPDFEGDAPRWTYLCSALAVVLYTWLDCLDGKQARRTGTSSPLGQLFDHGCDALSVNLLLGNIACSLSIGCGWAHALGELGVTLTWILAQWEEYHTGMMLYGNDFYGVLECNYTLAAVHVATLLLGPTFWRGTVAEKLHLPVLREWKMNEFIIIFMICVGFYQAVCNIVRVARFDTSTMPAAERGHKQLGQGAAVAHLALIVSLVGVGCLWLWQPCVTPWLCRTQNATFGLVYALFASQLIVAHMAKEPFAPNYAVLLLFAGAALNRSVQWVQPHAVTWVVFVLVLSAYLHYVVSVIRQICGHLDIPCLTIRPKKQAAAAGADE